jgi:hypothetical protein
MSIQSRKTGFQRSDRISPAGFAKGALCGYGGSGRLIIAVEAVSK